MKPLKVLTILAITVIAATLLIQTPKANAIQTSVNEKALNAISDILGLDVNKYTVKLYNNFSGPSKAYEGLTEDNIAYTLESTDSKLFILVSFLNGSLFYVDVQILNGSPSTIHYIQQLSTDAIAATKTLLTKIDSTTNAPIDKIQNILEKTTDLNTANRTEGNLKCQVIKNTVNINSTNSIEHESLYFMYTFNGANSPKSISFHFQDGVLRNYVDAWGIFIVGNEDVKVTREEAIEIARSDAIESSTNPLNFTSARTVTANLHMVVREKLTLYPFWFVELPLDYPNSTVNGWQEGIWADTGKIAYGHPTGMLGSMPDPNSISPSPSNEPIVQPSNLQLNNSASDNSPLIIVVIIILVISIISIATFRMKRGTK